ncbi:uncharacterized protein LOC111596647 [Drosophila hydei]|uniref:Uncharacterized protein LOC111596647 n=1 Tax=Drosophila hydei TaxID=7224 RepID=A0A6J1LHT3_DROHY|nr:uncharacterized protein LOC111596647 [Drosophila hydei]
MEGNTALSDVKMTQVINQLKTLRSSLNALSTYSPYTPPMMKDKSQYSSDSWKAASAVKLCCQQPNNLDGSSKTIDYKLQNANQEPRLTGGIQEHTIRRKCARFSGAEHRLYRLEQLN